MKKWISMLAVVMAFGAAGSAFAGDRTNAKYFLLDPVDMFGQNNHHDDAYWVSVYKKADMSGAEHLFLEVLWSGATFEYNAATKCFDGIDTYTYCGSGSNAYSLSWDGQVIETGSITPR